MIRYIPFTKDDSVYVIVVDRGWQPGCVSREPREQDALERTRFKLGATIAEFYDAGSLNDTFQRVIIVKASQV